MIVVLVVASGGSWETEALRVLGESSSAVVLKRCVDLPDLLASAASGQAQVAVLDAATTGLDAGAVEHLRRHGVHPVAVAGADDLDGARVGLRRVGVHDVVDEAALDTLPDAVSAVVARAETRGDARAHPLPPPPEQPPDGQPPDGPRGRVIAVWGPTGAPGRSLVASALAAELAGGRCWSMRTRTAGRWVRCSGSPTRCPACWLPPAGSCRVSWRSASRPCNAHWARA